MMFDLNAGRNRSCVINIYIAKSEAGFQRPNERQQR